MDDLEAPVKSGKKLPYIEGIRGLAAFMVVMSHYALAFYPAMISGIETQTHSKSIELWFYRSPLIFLLNGRLFVYVFFILSGYVLSKKAFISKDISYLNSSSVKRFTRLFIPAAVALMIAFLLIKLNLNFNSQVSTITKSPWFNSLAGNPSVVSFLRSLFYKTMFFSDNSYITVLWTISLEFYGSLLVFAIIALTSKIRNAFFILAVTFFILFVGKNYAFCAFICGICMNYIVPYEIKNGYFKKMVLSFFLVLGVFLGGFPNIYRLATPSVKGTIYHFFNYQSIIDLGAFINCMGAFFLIIVAVKSDKLKYFFSSRALDFLGAISFSMYLIHVLVLRSFSAVIFLKIQNEFSYNISVLITLLLSLLGIFFVSYLSTIYIDRKSVAISSCIYKRYFEKNKIIV